MKTLRKLLHMRRDRGCIYHPKTVKKPLRVLFRYDPSLLGMRRISLWELVFLTTYFCNKKSHVNSQCWNLCFFHTVILLFILNKVYNVFLFYFHDHSILKLISYNLFRLNMLVPTYKISYLPKITCEYDLKRM